MSLLRTLETALNLFTTFRSLPNVTKQRQVAAYEVNGPTTVFVRASHCRVTVQRTVEPQVQIQCEMRQAFGWDWVTEHDEAGVYIVLKRRPLVGKLSTADLTLIVPADAYLAFHLTPGSIHLADFEGRLSVEPMEAQTS